MTRRARRLLIVAPPGYGHLFPMVPLAWALKVHGHDVLVATCGVSVNAAMRAGLPAANVAPLVDFNALQVQHRSAFASSYPPADLQEAHQGSQVFAEIADVMTDGVVDLCRSWRPDLIVHTPEAGAALVAAAALDLPAVFVSVGIDHTPERMSVRYETMAGSCGRHHVSRLAVPVAWIDLSPPSLRIGRGNGWPMRYVQYHGGGPTAALPDIDKPRVAVTLGTVTPAVTGLAPLRRVVAAAASIDAQFVIAHGSSSGESLGPLPPNVQASHWHRWDGLLAQCSGAIHHGGFGTTLATTAFGLPQLLLPQGADQFQNARALVRAGAAMAPDIATLDEGALQCWLRADHLRGAAARLQAEIAGLPPPADVASDLVRIV